MSDYDLHVDWYQRCQELEAQLTAANARVEELEAHMTELKERYPSSPWIYKLTTTALEQEKGDDRSV